ncbi:hypothetical protein [Myxosarcina sp. GI1]|uniref:hypothetical protein n=1 Tax=Myxosarcina sp. GI1 TaxID=1541065 RepID=UPI00068FCEBB|nr:hypothetical protein [Myxosarcina sp. GI1]
MLILTFRFLLVDLSLYLKLSDLVVSQARVWGFICNYRESNSSWSIAPKKISQRWRLLQAEDRWVLMIGEVSQLYLNAEEAIAFLEARQRKKTK